MTTRKIKKVINGIIYGTFGFVIAIIFIRVLFQAIGANPDSEFVQFWYDLSSIFIAPFINMYPNIRIGDSNIVFELSSIVAMLFYLMVAYFCSKLFTAFIEKSAFKILQNLIDFGFKIVEFLLFARFIFKLTNASTASSIVDFVYRVTSIFYLPFSGENAILPTIEIPEYGVIFETSTLIILMIVIVFDIVTEGMLSKIHEALKPEQRSFLTPATPQSNQNITINLPNQQPIVQQPPQVIDQRTVKVYPASYIPSQMQAAYPGYGQNHLENQRPVPNQQVQSGQYVQPNIGQQTIHNPNQGGY